MNVPLDPGGRWLLLLHQLPPKPDSFRVRIWRRLQRLGAVAIKNSVYVLPRTDAAQEDFHWIRSEIVGGSGEAYVCEARFVEGLSDAEIEDLFHAARDADYGQVAEEAKRLGKQLSAKRALDEDRRAAAEAEVAQLRRRFDEVASIDFFGAPSREPLNRLLSDLEAKLRRPSAAPPSRASRPQGEFRGRVWVTRRSIHVDRMASAWLIRRFIDPEAEFRFVTGNAYTPSEGELRFDMFDGEFTHEDDRCTFETLLRRFGLEQPGLHALAEIVHDIDLKDAKFGRPEVTGVEHLIAGITMAHKDDEARLERGEAVFTDLYTYFTRKAERDRRLEKETES